MAERYVDLGDLFGRSGGLRISIKRDRGHTRGVRKDLDVFHRGCSTLGCDTQGLEDSLLADPPSSERRWWRWLRAAGSTATDCQRGSPLEEQSGLADALRAPSFASIDLSSPGFCDARKR